MIHLLIHKANTMLGIIEVFNSLHNYAFETFLLMLSHTQCAPDNICKTKQARDYLKAHFMDSNCFSPQKRKSPCLCFSSLPRDCYCGTCRVIIATFVPAINSGPPFCMDAMRKSM